jgi:hypothetical protein
MFKMATMNSALETALEMEFVNKAEDLEVEVAEDEEEAAEFSCNHMQMRTSAAITKTKTK